MVDMASICYNKESSEWPCNSSAGSKPTQKAANSKINKNGLMFQEGIPFTTNRIVQTHLQLRRYEDAEMQLEEIVR